MALAHCILGKSLGVVCHSSLPIQKSQNRPKCSTSLLCTTHKTLHFPSRYLVHFPSLLNWLQATFTRRTKEHFLANFRDVKFYLFLVINIVPINVFQPHSSYPSSSLHDSQNKEQQRPKWTFVKTLTAVDCVVCVFRRRLPSTHTRVRAVHCNRPQSRPL